MPPRGVDQAYLVAAFLCGIGPLAVGSCVFFSWLILRWDFLPLIGLLTIAGGIYSFAFGLFFLGKDLSLARRQGTAPGTLLRRSVLPACLLLLNFPVAGTYWVAACVIEARYTATVSNEASVPAESLVVQGGGVREEFGRLEPGERRTRGIYFEQDGELRIEGRVGDRRIEGLVEGYVARGQGGWASVRIRGDGSVPVTTEGHGDD